MGHRYQIGMDFSKAFYALETGKFRSTTASMSNSE